MKNRVGTFEIARELIHSDPSAVLKVMARCIIIRAEYMFASNDIAYVALCADFDEIPTSSLPPAYRPILQRGAEGAVDLVRWERVGC